MNLRRVFTMLKHSWYHVTHSPEVMVDMLWFPMMQFIVFGLISTFFIKENAHVILFGYVLWIVIETAQYSISVGALWEIWAKSFSSLFISPLTLKEFIASQMLAGLLKGKVMFMFLSGLTILLYGFNVFSLGTNLLYYFILVLLFGWAAGMFVLGLILRYGTTIQSLAWSLILVIQPLGAVFFPVSAIPEAIRWLSFVFPTTYVFEALRYQLATGQTHTQYLLISLCIVSVFFVGAYFFMQRMYDRSREKGAFVRMETG